MATTLISSLNLPHFHPCIPLNYNQVQVLEQPCDFYNLLRSSILKCKKRIVLSSLYLGTGNLETQLANDLTTALLTNSNLEVHLLFDYTRGTRIEKSSSGNSTSCKKLLQPLAALKRAHVSFYLSPEYGHWFKRYFILPLPKVNEVVSLHHMKAFVFDDDVIISGANLSDQYFTNRADRYILFKNCPTLANYFTELIETIETFSLNLQSDGSFQLHKSWKYHPLSWKHNKQFVIEARQRMNNLNAKYSVNVEECINQQQNSCPTFALPIIQMNCLGIRDDFTYTSKLMSSCPPGSSLRLASGYFNLTNEYIDILLNQSAKKVNCNVLMASEPVNSFYKAKGLIGKIPSVYTQFSHEFLRQIISQPNNSIQLWSFLRKNWTFHTKGLWINYPSTDLMVATIGSPNFGWRSVYKDNECQVLLVTRDSNLKSSLVNEYETVWKYSQRITKETDLPKVSFWVQFVSRFIKRFF